MPKRILLLIFLYLCTPTFGSIGEPLKLQVSLEQLDVKITKSFSIRANSINTISAKVADGISMEEIYLELSNGTFVKLDAKKMKNSKKAQWNLNRNNIKAITFTARTNSKDKNQIEFVLIK